MWKETVEMGKQLFTLKFGEELILLLLIISVILGIAILLAYWKDTGKWPWEKSD